MKDVKRHAAERGEYNRHRGDGYNHGQKRTARNRVYRFVYRVNAEEREDYEGDVAERALRQLL